ncbi:ribosome maturation factor RimP [Streptomyces sp. WI04-05B]|uniref:ribosome maturation factor RimP n=1 Tax=Streptomyces TaxID=1883 RepID=UPI0029B976B0|nr:MULTISPECIES: ribosome maturation factor RimP [unclassified Streptomyces]MDX2542029.1 ribosome maturation factor RimP [Streptomyces sp. WI04-05B]MDX2587111.1 ribosome maturation factor RimP [Streptomyces sp. WI04-05A]MDX3750059.1 ribosome maturation factor RimP [Streptomyces sp. AK08-02]
MSTTQSERLRELLEPLVSSQGLDLEEIAVESIGRKRVLRVVVDSDDGADLDAIADVSRALSAKLDETDAMGAGEYTLEVGTPGAERELTEHRHYVRAVERLVRFQLTEGGELVARILTVDDEGMDLEVPGVKGRKATARRLAFGDIDKARVQVEFNRKDKSGKNDMQDEQDMTEEEEA